VASLFVILARNAHDAVIFRRGPSKEVLLIKWDRKKDTFETGQWFKGRIFERRCDLSPSGDLLVYLAAKHKGPIHTWTAVSRPPYLTALALWPNLGTWGGGGLFESEYSLLLNHESGHRELADGFRLARNMKVRLLGDWPGRGEDDPIHHIRLVRDGWVLIQEGEHTGYQKKGAMRWRFTKPKVYEKRMQRKKSIQFLRMLLLGIFEQGGHKYVLDFEVLNEKGASLLKLPRIDWADWDSNGDLLFSDRGKLFRLPWSSHREDGRELAKELADFSTLTFTAKEAPKKALTW
jgi:hypothetical protein